MSFKVIGIGEALWDLLPRGPQLGGAPANFAFHACQLGAESRIITRIGNDEDGRRMLQRFEEMDIDCSTVQVDDHLPTGAARVAFEPDGSPRFTIVDGVAWDSLALTDEALEAVRNANAVCFGTLAQRTAEAASVIHSLLAETPQSSVRVFDINLRQGFYNREMLDRSLKSANILKLNEHELTVLLPMFGLRGNMRQMASQLADRYNLNLVALTRAEHGSLLYQRGDWSEFPGRKVDVLDTIGAGDAFTAALVLGLLNQLPLDDIHRIAADVASFVCSQPGATPPLPTVLRAAFAPTCFHV